MAQETGLTKAKDEQEEKRSVAMTTATTTAVDKEINGADDPEQPRSRAHGGRALVHHRHDRGAGQMDIDRHLARALQPLSSWSCCP